MARSRQHFRQTDVTKAVRAVAKAGVTVARVEVSPDGRIVVIAGAPGQEQNSSTAELDRELGEFEACHGAD